MSFRRGGGRRGGGFGSRGGGRGRGGFRQMDTGPPERVIEFGIFTHTCEDQLILKCTDTERVPWFNAPIFLENIQQIGKVDEIFGSIRNHSVSVKLSDDVKASSFNLKETFYIDPYKLFPLSKFLDPQGGRGRGGPRGGGGRGSRGGSFSGRGRGGFSRSGRGFGDRGRGGFGDRGRGGFGDRGRGGFGDRGRGSFGDRGRGGGHGFAGDRGRGGFGGRRGDGGGNSWSRGGSGPPAAKKIKFD